MAAFSSFLYSDSDITAALLRLGGSVSVARRITVAVMPIVHVFVPQVLSTLRRRRVQFGKMPTVLPRGPVQRLVVLDGAWNDHRWNDRWLAMEMGSENVKSTSFRFMELCYYSEDNGQLIHRISSKEICSVRVINGQIHGQTDKKSKGSFSSSFQDTGCNDTNESSLWSIITNNCKDFDELQFCFLISTWPRGHGQAKEYLFRARSAAECDVWVDLISKMLDSNKIKTHWFSRLRRSCRSFYQNTWFQIAAGVMININFITNVIAVQANPDPDSDLGHVLSIFDLVLSVLFAVELALNIFVSRPSEFCRDYWNW